MAKYKGTSYDSLKSYLESVDVDTSNMDNDTLDYQYLNRLRKRSGEELSTDEKTKGNITLKQYLADAQANDIKSQGIANAENQARQDTAYNDYVNSKLAKYLGIAEANNGTQGYKGITEGNRIQLANQEKNVASNIQQNKQSAIQQYLQNYQSAIQQNSAQALDQETTMQATMDQKKELEKSTYRAGVDNSVEDIIAKYTPASDGYYDNSALNEITKYVNESTLEDNEKNDILRQVNARYNFRDLAQPKGGSGQPTTDTEGNVVDNIGLNHGETLKAENNKSIDETTNNAGRIYNFKLQDGQSRSIKAAFDNNSNTVAQQILSTFALAKAGKDINALNDSISKLTENEWGAFTFKTDKGKEICKVIVYKKSNGENVVFVYNKSRLYNSDHESDFNALWNKISSAGSTANNNSVATSA